MATEQCGKTQVNYDSDKCSYKCTKWPGGSFTWYVTCPGGIHVSGTGLQVGGGHKGLPEGMEVAGKLQMLAKDLENEWKRPVKVPSKLRGKVLRRRTVKGTPEEIAKALGLTLGAKR